MFSATLLTVLAVDLLATSGDLSATWGSPMYPKLYSNDNYTNPIGRPITKLEDAWIGSIIDLGSIFGALPAGLLANKLGRKKSLLAIAVPHIMAFIMFAYGNNVSYYLVGRFLNGLSYGAGLAIIPMYIAEITKDSNRGALSSSVNIFWTLGDLIPYAIGPYLSVKVFNLTLVSIPTAFFVVFLLIAPESPYYLVQEDKSKKAQEALGTLHPSYSEDELQKAVTKIKNTIEESESTSTLEAVKDPRFRYALFISLILIMLEGFCGMSPILNYMQLLLESSEYDIPSDILSTIVGVWYFVTSFFTGFVVDRVGRKIPLIISFFGCSVSLGLLGSFFYVRDNTDHDTSGISWLPVISIFSYILFFNFGIGPIPWTITSEIFPSSIAATAIAFVTAVWSACSFLTILFFNSLTNWIGNAGTFWIFAGVCTVGMLFTFWVVPETKGKSFVEIQEILENKMTMK